MIPSDLSPNSSDSTGSNTRRESSQTFKWNNLRGLLKSVFFVWLLKFPIWKKKLFGRPEDELNFICLFRRKPEKLIFLDLL